MFKIALTKILQDITKVLLPPLCFGCNTLLIRGEQHLCTFCRNGLPFTDYNFKDENPIDRIFYGRVDIKKASALFSFTKNGIVKQLIHHLKYKNQEQIGLFLGDWYGQILKNDTALGHIDAVVPIPLHKNKLRKRGYNQVALFSKRLAFHLNTDYVDSILIKTANTKTQTAKGRLGRLQSKKALYTLTDYDYFKNKNVLLVDDVITSGATMAICVKALLKTKGITVQITSMAVVAQFQ